MNGNEVIESYVHDVAACLPRRKRDDVAFELRALLSDELAAKAQAEGRPPDKAMAMDLLRSFGEPAEAAKRYHERPALLDSADTHHFLIWGFAAAVYVSIRSALPQAPFHDDGDEFLKLLGALVLIFAAIAWWRRRQRARGFGWKPKRVAAPYAASRPLSVLLGALTLIPLVMYAAPRWFAETAFFGAIPTHGLVLDQGFADSSLRIATIVALALQTAVYLWIAIDGRWRTWSRWTSIAVVSAIGLLFARHAGVAADNLVFATQYANQIAAPIFASTATGMLLCVFYEVYREWARVMPAPGLESGRA